MGRGRVGISPVEDSDDNLMPGSLCNVIPGMVNIEIAGGWGEGWESGVGEGGVEEGGWGRLTC